MRKVYEKILFIVSKNIRSRYSASIFKDYVTKHFLLNKNYYQIILVLDRRKKYKIIRGRFLC